MKLKYSIILLFGFLVLGCQTPNQPTQKESKGKPGTCQKMMARITFYHAGEDKWGSRIASSNRRAKEGRTAAAEKAFPFHSLVEVDALRGKVGNGILEIEDRGTAVESRKATRGAYPVFDVFVSSRSRMNLLAKSFTEPVPVTVYF